MRRLLPFVLLLHFIALVGQDTNPEIPPPDPKDAVEIGAAPRLFLDCGVCDMSFLRQEMTYVDHVRDQALADIHIWVNRFPSAGGFRYDILVMGKKSLSGKNDSLSLYIPPTKTSDEVRKEILRYVNYALVPYFTKMGLVEGLNVTIKNPNGASSGKRVQVADPWNFWIFEIDVAGSVSKESLVESTNLNLRLDANRVTEEWRFRGSTYLYENKKKFKTEDGVIGSRRNDNGANAILVKSLGEHLSAGLNTSYSSSTYNNIKASYYGGPAVEYNFFPYSQALRREFTFAYSVGINDRDYQDLTIYNLLEETLYRQSLQVNLRIRQPWGSVFAGVRGANYMHDFSKNRLETDVSLSVRVVKGLSFRMSNSFEIIRDQLSLPAGEASLEDLLLQQRRQATDYDLSFSMGLNYTFGSIYNNVVNTRL